MLSRNSSDHPVNGAIQRFWEEWRASPEGQTFHGSVDMSALWVAFLAGWEAGLVAYTQNKQREFDGR